MYGKKVECKNGVYSVYVHLMKPTGKRYVGMTGQKPERRFQNGCGYEKNVEFYADIKKYGWHSVETEIIAVSKDFELACQFENAGIKRYDTLNPEYGYNQRSSGDENIPNESVGRNISKAKMGHNVTEETRKKLSLYNRRPVYQLDYDGNIIQMFPSVTAAANAVGGKKANIGAVCSGRKPTCKGYKWKYAV